LFRSRRRSGRYVTVGRVDDVEVGARGVSGSMEKRSVMLDVRADELGDGGRVATGESDEQRLVARSGAQAGDGCSRTAPFVDR